MIGDIIINYDGIGVFVTYVRKILSIRDLDVSDILVGLLMRG